VFLAAAGAADLVSGIFRMAVLEPDNPRVDTRSYGCN